MEKINSKQLLMTQEQANQIPALYAQDGKGMNAIAYIKFFTPWSNWTWYATEYSLRDRTFFGYVISPMEPAGELGYFTVDELQSIRHPQLGLTVERDIHFRPTPLKELKG